MSAICASPKFLAITFALDKMAYHDENTWRGRSSTKWHPSYVGKTPTSAMRFVQGVFRKPGTAFGMRSRKSWKVSVV